MRLYGAILALLTSPAIVLAEGMPVFLQGFPYEVIGSVGESGILVRSRQRAFSCSLLRSGSVALLSECLPIMTMLEVASAAAYETALELYLTAMQGKSPEQIDDQLMAALAGMGCEAKIDTLKQLDSEAVSAFVAQTGVDTNVPIFDFATVQANESILRLISAGKVAMINTYTGVRLVGC